MTTINSVKKLIIISSIILWSCASIESETHNLTIEKVNSSTAHFDRANIFFSNYKVGLYGVLHK